MEAILKAVASRPGFADVKLLPEPELAALDLRAPRVAPPPALADICADDVETRAGHTHGKSYRDVVRNVAGRAHPSPGLRRLPEH